MFLGAGAYNHYIPPVVSELAAREEFVTAYTPYQAEMSQGILQSIFEYQTEIANLTGMDASNASHYDGATAIADGILMCMGAKTKAVCPTRLIRNTRRSSELILCRTVSRLFLHRRKRRYRFGRS